MTGPALDRYECGACCFFCNTTEGIRFMRIKIRKCDKKLHKRQFLKRKNAIMNKLKNYKRLTKRY